ncbi:MAG: putative Ig domain-containing protein [Acidobacteriota bacterium]
MSRAWIGFLLFASAGFAEAQISVGSSAFLTSGYVGSTYCFIKNQAGGFTCPTGLLTLVSSGGTGPYTYTVISGSLPPGMTVRNDPGFVGLLDGKPTTIGSYPVTIRSTDSKGATGEVSFTIPVLASFVSDVIKGTVGVAFSASFSCSAGGTLVGLPPGITAVGINMSGTPTTSGTYTVVVACANVTVLQPFQINGPFTASPTSISLTGTSNGPTSKAVVQAGAQRTDQTFTATVAGGAWLTAVASGTTPGTVTATANPTGLAAGVYNATITVTSPGPPNASVPIAVKYTVAAAAAARLVATPLSLNYSLTRGGAAGTKTVVLSNAGSGTIGPLTFKIVGLNSTEIETKVSITPPGGSITPTSPLTLSVTANSNLTGAFYTANLVATNAAGATQVEIPLIVQISSPRYRLSQSALFLGAFGDAPGLVRQPISKNLIMWNDVPTQVEVGVFPGSGVIIPKAPWLSILPAGQFNINPPGGTFQVIPNPTGLSVGDHYGVIYFVSLPRGVTEQIEEATVVFRIIPADAPGGFFPNFDSAIVFETTTTSSPAPKGLSLTTISTTPVPFTITVEYHEGQEFLSVSPTAGSTVAGSPALVTLSVPVATRPAEPNILTADVVIHPGGLAAVRVPVVLIKRFANAADAVDGTGRKAASCVPTTLVPVRRSPLQDFSATAGVPTDLDVTVIDDCGSFDSAQTVTATFSNGDSPVELTFIGSGRFTGSYSGRTPSDSLALTITASSADLKLRGTTEIGGTLFANPSNPPRIFDGGVLNGASFAIGGPLSPGSFVTLFGEKLANSQVSAPSVPLPYTLAGSQLLIGGKETPVFFASDGQVNAIIPYGIPTDGPVSVVAVRDGLFAPQQSIVMTPAAPGIFMYGDKQGIIVGPTAIDLANSTHPVSSGQTVVVYCTGLGEVDHPLTAGSPTSTAFLTKTVNTVTMTIGGIAAKVDFAGLTPGSTGLYQVNAVVPAGVTPGDRVPVVLTEAGQSSAPAFISVR